MRWRKSSYSGNASGNCVEVAHTPTTIHVRDTKARQAEAQAYSHAAWNALERQCRSARHAPTAQE